MSSPGNSRRTRPVLPAGIMMIPNVPFAMSGSPQMPPPPLSSMSDNTSTVSTSPPISLTEAEQEAHQDAPLGDADADHNNNSKQQTKTRLRIFRATPTAPQHQQQQELKGEGEDIKITEFGDVVSSPNRDEQEGHNSRDSPATTLQNPQHLYTTPSQQSRDAAHTILRHVSEKLRVVCGASGGVSSDARNALTRTGIGSGSYGALSANESGLIMTRSRESVHVLSSSASNALSASPSFSGGAGSSPGYNSPSKKPKRSAVNGNGNAVGSTSYTSLTSASHVRSTGLQFQSSITSIEEQPKTHKEEGGGAAAAGSGGAAGGDVTPVNDDLDFDEEEEEEEQDDREFRDISLFEGIFRPPRHQGSYKRLQVLGAGSFGETWLVEWTPEVLSPEDAPAAGTVLCPSSAQNQQQQVDVVVPSGADAARAVARRRKSCASGVGVANVLRRKSHAAQGDGDDKDDENCHQDGDGGAAGDERGGGTDKDTKKDRRRSVAAGAAGGGGGGGEAARRRSTERAGALASPATASPSALSPSQSSMGPRHSSRARMSEQQAALADIIGVGVRMSPSFTSRGARRNNGPPSSRRSNSAALQPGEDSQQTYGSPSSNLSASGGGMNSTGTFSPKEGGGGDQQQQQQQQQQQHISHRRRRVSPQNPRGTSPVAARYSTSTSSRASQQSPQQQALIAPSGVSHLANTKPTVSLKDGRTIAAGRVFVCKVESHDAIAKKAKIGSGVMVEQRILASCAHPCIVAYVDEFSTPEFDCLVMEYVDGGDLREEVKRRKELEKVRFFSERSILFLFAQICMALEYLHRHNILHRDLKTSNLLFSKRWVVKLADFGFAKQYEVDVDNDVSVTGLGTPFYMAPEALMCEKYSEKADMWSAGIILYELITFDRPFDAENILDLRERVCNCDTISFPEIQRAEISSELKLVVESLLQKEPEKRPSAKQVLQTEIMTQAMKDCVSAYENAAKRSQNAVDKVWADVLREHYELVISDELSGPKSSASHRKLRNKHVSGRLSRSASHSSLGGDSSVAGRSVSAYQSGTLQQQPSFALSGVDGSPPRHG